MSFLAGTVLANAGDMFTQVAVFWTALSLGGKAISIGGLGGAWVFARMMMGFVSGPIIDRFNRRNIMLWMHLGLSLLSFAVFALSRMGLLQMWHLWAFLVGEAVFGIPSDLAFDSLVPDLVGKDRLLKVNGMMTSWGMADNLIEAAASGFVYALWGPAPLFLFNAVMYLVGVIGALAVPPEDARCHHAPRGQGWNPFADVKRTTRFIRREGLLIRLLALSQINGILFVPLFFIPPLVSDALEIGGEGFGILQAMILGGLLLGGFLASTVGAKWPKVHMMIGGRVLYALGFLALGIFYSPAIAVIAFFLFGLGYAGPDVYGMTLQQQLIPSSHRGRISGISSFVGGVIQPGALALFTILIDGTSARFVLILLSFLVLAAAALQSLLLPMNEKNWVLGDPEAEPVSD